MIQISFLDKLKQGVTDAGQKAKTAVEVSRIKNQIQEMQKQMEEKQAKIGETVFAMIVNNQPVSINTLIEDCCNEIITIQSEIKLLQSKSKELHNEKDCQCGKVVALDTKFCPTCGHQFSIPPEVIDISVDPPARNETKKDTSTTNPLE